MLILNNVALVHAINHQTNIIESNNGSSEVKVAIVGVIVTIISIILSSAITISINRHNQNHSDIWNKLLYHFNLNKMAVSGVRVFNILVWKPLIKSKLMHKLNSSNSISKRDKQRLGHILGDYYRWQIYLNDKVSNTSLLDLYLSDELKTLNNLDVIIKLIRKKSDSHGINRKR